MIVLIAGSSHTGKTLLAQKLLEKYHFPYLSIDQLKMGLIRSGQTSLTPLDDDALTEYLWPIIREMIKTAIENKQNLIVEGCYIPYTYQKDFEKEYLDEIRYKCLVFSNEYIEDHYEEIIQYENEVEARQACDYAKEEMKADNQEALKNCLQYHCDYLLIKDDYHIEFEL